MLILCFIVCTFLYEENIQRLHTSMLKLVKTTFYYNKITNTMPQVTENQTALNILLGKDLVRRP